MIVVSVLVLAVGLSMDAMAVATSRGLAAAHAGWREALVVGAWFGAFQAGMPLLGWLVGETLGPLVVAWDHWIAFALLGGIGGKMLYEAWHADGEAEVVAADAFGWRVMAPLAVATSIDALAAGVTLPTLGAPPIATVIAIGLTTATLSVIGVLAGRTIGARAGRRMDALGGVVLIGLGTKILIEHLAQ